MKRRFLVLLCMAILPMLFACGGSAEVKDIDEPEDEVPSITVFSDKKMEYAVVIAARSSDTVYNFADIFEDLSGTAPVQKNDRWDETPLEILVGETGRELSVNLLAELRGMASENEFHYIIAEKDGKIAVLADNEIGYQYLQDRLSTVYTKDGTMKIPVGCHDLQTVSWEEYYNSEYYAAALEKEEKRIQREKEKEAEDMKRKQEELERYRKLAVSFNNEDFGNRQEFPKNKYNPPLVYPEKSHPRVLFTKSNIDTIRANLTAEENKAAYERYISQSEQYVTGMFTKLSDKKTHNMDYNIMANIEAKAFRYAMTGEEIYGYQAIFGIKNALLTLDIPDGTLGDDCRAFGYVMYIAGCVYDWCYDLLTDDCKKQIINGCVTLMGTEMEIGVPPTKQGTVYGHGTEAQILRDWLTLAIACYDEAPDIYELVAGRIFSEYVDSNNYFFASGNHWEGSAYGPYRLHFTLYTQLLFDRMTNGKCVLFSDDMHEVAITLLHYIRPDNQPLRIGDVWGENVTKFSLGHYYNVMFYAANYYKDPVLKSYAWNGLNNFKTFSMSNNALTPVMLLALNDPSVGHENHQAVSLTRLTKTPLESAFARTSWDDKDAVMVYMTMNKAFGAGHTHMDCGSFQIFYKGILASDSGKYSSWGDFHHKGYTMQTISSNSILVYNSNLADTKTGNFVYSGGQSITADRVAIPGTLDTIIKLPGQNQCQVLGSANVENEGKYQYSFMAGDMTAAYDAETVDEVTRYMLAIMTDEKDYPLVFATYDRITSDDASYKKSALLHVQQEPTVTDDGFILVTNTTNGNSGKMVVQSVMTDTEFTLIGGEGKRYWLHDKNADTDDTVPQGALEEYGWGRIEISPAEEAKTDYLLTVMYVTDASNNAAPVKALDISTDVLAGTQLFGKALLFPKTEKLLNESASFTVVGDKTTECYIAGVQAGKWIISSGNETKIAEVAEGSGILTFIASAGKVTISPYN